jgi:hypothetical protein
MLQLALRTVGLARPSLHRAVHIDRRRFQVTAGYSSALDKRRRHDCGGDAGRFRRPLLNTVDMLKKQGN